MKQGSPRGDLLFSVDQETGITRIKRNQVAVRIASRVESVAGAPQNVTLFISDNRRFIVETSRD